jgi:hypothetical protein
MEHRRIVDRYLSALHDMDVAKIGTHTLVHAEQSVVDLAGPRWQPRELAAAERRYLGVHGELVARQPVGHAEADEVFDGAHRRAPSGASCRCSRQQPHQ